MLRTKDLIGQKFGRLIVIQRMDNNKRDDTQWLCRCDCGKNKIILGYNLKNGTTKSCGCLRKENNTKHSHTARGKESKTYRAWANMIQRCTNPKNERYRYYGGRGIQVCKRWMKFENFLEDMGESPKEYQIDRINNNKGYCKSNCHWVLLKEQQRNRSNNHLETYDGKIQCLTVWAEEFDIERSVVGARLRRGWSIKKALTTPVQKRSVV